MYSEKGADSVTVSFSNSGIYTFDSLKIVNQPVASFKDKLEKLKSSGLQNVNMDVNRITGSAMLKSPGLLVIALRYSRGWSAYVDGQEQEIYKANVMYMGLDLKVGEQRVELRYKTPYLILGRVTSLVGVIIFVLYIFSDRFYRRNKAANLHSDHAIY